MRKALLCLSFIGFVSVIHGRSNLAYYFTRALQGNEDIPDEDFKKIQEIVYVVNYFRTKAEEAAAASRKARTDEDGYGRPARSGVDANGRSEKARVGDGIRLGGGGGGGGGYGLVGDGGEAVTGEDIMGRDVSGRGSPFEYRFPSLKPRYTNEPDFAFGPSDPRYYQDFVNFVKPPSETSSPPPPPPVPVTNDMDDDLAREPETVASFRSAIEGDQREESSRTSTPSGLHYTGEEVDGSPSHSAVYQSPVSEIIQTDDKSDIYFTAIVAGCSAATVVAVIAIGISCYRLQKNAKAAAEVDYPAYGVTGPHKDASPTSGDRRLAQSAQMYHYQHQKQQIIAMESRASNERQGSISDAESDEENEEGDYTVYECPGLASTGEMEVKNPLFQDDQTPATPVRAATNSSSKPSSHDPPK